MKNLVDFKVVLSVESVEKWLKGSMEITAYKVSIDPSSKKVYKEDCGAHAEWTPFSRIMHNATTKT